VIPGQWPRAGDRAWCPVQAGVDPSIGSFVEDNPRFGFAGVAGGNEFLLGVRRMDLNGEPFLHIEKFQQHGESGKMAGQLTEHLLRRTLEQLSDGATFERAVGDETGVIIPVAQNPGLAMGPSPGRGRRAGSPIVDLPESILVDRLEAQR